MQYVIRDHTSPLSRELVIEDRHHQKLFRAHGPVVRVRDELHLEDAHGAEQAYIKDPVLSDGSTFEIYRGGAHVADVKAVAVGNALQGYDIMLRSGGEPLRARGDMFERHFTITEHGQRAAQVKRHDGNLEVETEAGHDDVLVLAGVIAMAAMTDLRLRSVGHGNS